MTLMIYNELYQRNGNLLGPNVKGQQSIPVEEETGRVYFHFELGQHCNRNSSHKHTNI